MTGKKKFTALGAYIFAGGFTLGVREHFEVLTHFEDGTYGVETAMKNGFIQTAHTVPDQWPTARYKGKVDFLYSNPPCAPWSVASAGRATHWTQDPRVNAVKRTFGLLDALEPDVWAWESVRPAWTKGRELVETLVNQAHARGYHATVLLVEGTRHGVPQRRPRFFLVFHRYVIDWQASGQKTKPTVAKVFNTKFKTQTLGNHDTVEMRRHLKLLKKAKVGERLHATFNRLNPDIVASRPEGKHLPGRPSFQRVRLQEDKPSHTLTGGVHFFHPTESRLISVEESAALCGYPRSFVFHGSLGKQYAQVAQAVMPPVGEYLARMVRQALERKQRRKELLYDQVEIFTDHVDRIPLTRPVGGRMSLALAVPAQVAPRAPSFKRPSDGRDVAVKSRIKGCGYFIRELLVAGKSTEAIIAAVKSEFPNSKAKASDVYWNKRKLAAQGGVP